MRNTLTADDVLIRMGYVLITNLSELKDVQDVPEQKFQYGEKTAYIECLELMQAWEKAELFRIDFEVESFFNFK